MARPSHSLIVACIALFVALGGTGYAVSQLPKNSVGQRELKKNSVTSVKVKDGTLFARDFRKGELPAGAKGERGQDGARGPGGTTSAAFEKIPDVVALTPASTPVATITTPASPTSSNPGPMVLSEESLVELTATVPVMNTAATTEMNCEIAGSLNGGSFSTLTDSYPKDLAAGPGFVDVLAISIPLILPAGSHRFRLICAAGGTVLVLNNAVLAAYER